MNKISFPVLRERCALHDPHIYIARPCISFSNNPATARERYRAAAKAQWRWEKATGTPTRQYDAKQFRADQRD